MATDWGVNGKLSIDGKTISWSNNTTWARCNDLSSGVVGHWIWAYAPAGQSPVIHGSIDILADGTTKSSDGYSGKWEWKGDKLILTWSGNNSIDTLTLSADGKVIAGTNNSHWNVRGTR